MYPNHDAKEKEPKEKALVIGSQDENIALMEMFQEDPKKEKIHDYHFRLYMQQILRLSSQYSGHVRNTIYKSIPASEIANDQHDVINESFEVDEA